MSLSQTAENSPSQDLSATDQTSATSGSGVQHLLTQLARAFGKIPCVRKAILFGSRAREDHGDRDDIDIAVSCPEATDEQWAQIESLVTGLPTLLRVDLVRLDTAPTEVRQEIQIEGILFFEPWGRRWTQFCDALDRFGWALERSELDDLAREGVLHRFSRCVDLFHKVLRRLLWSRGLVDHGMKDAMVLAYQQGWIADEERWIGLLQARFWAERSYDETRTNPLVAKMPRHHELLLQARESLRDRFDLG